MTCVDIEILPEAIKDDTWFKALEAELSKLNLNGVKSRPAFQINPELFSMLYDPDRSWGLNYFTKSLLELDGYTSRNGYVVSKMCGCFGCSKEAVLEMKEKQVLAHYGTHIDISLFPGAIAYLHVFSNPGLDTGVIKLIY